MNIIEHNKKLNDVLTIDIIESWIGNVILNAGTGSGKTYFVLNNLSEYCKKKDMKILYICNRTALYEEVLRLIIEFEITNIDVITYQSIESNLKNGNKIEYSHDILACDEFHHVLEYYNKYTDLSYEYIMNHHSQKIFMSATCDDLFNMFVNKGIVEPSQYYKITKSYDYVNEFIFYKRKNAHRDIIKRVLENTDDKLILFTKSMKEAISFYTQYEDIASFYCSKHTSDTLALSILEKNKDSITNESFKGRLLIATSALDVGITLKDKSIKHIISDIFNVNNAIQCFGRKRLVDESDRCIFYIHNYARREINLQRNNYIKDIRLFKTDKQAFFKKMYADRDYNNPFVYFDKNLNDFKCNELAYIAILLEENNLDKMIHQEWINNEGFVVKGIGYKSFMLNKLGISNTDYRVSDYETYEEVCKVNSLEDYLMSLAGVKLFKVEQNELIAKIGLKDSRGRLQKSINLLNVYLDENKLPYHIVSERETKSTLLDGSKNPNFKKMYWKVLI